MKDMTSCADCSQNPSNPNYIENSTETNIEYTNGACLNSTTCESSCKNIKIVDWLGNIPIASGREKFDCVEIRFKNGRKGYYKNSQKLPLYMGDTVVVEVTQEIKVVQDEKSFTEIRIFPNAYDVGIINLTGELVRVQMNKKKIDSQDAKMPKIIRKATSEDIEQWNIIKNKEDEYRIKSREFADKFGLKMKFFDVEMQGDGTKGTFFYTAEERIDFRQLIVEMTSYFGIKIEMRQVGPRQEAARLGGIGSCGRELCCSTWMTEFPNVSPNAARFQQLAINVDSLTGACGKIKCCLNFELDSYLNALQSFPKQGVKIDTVMGLASSRKIDVFKKVIWLSYDKQDSFLWYEISVEQFKEMVSKNEQGEKVSLEEYSQEYIRMKEVKIEDTFVSVNKEVEPQKLKEEEKSAVVEKKNLQKVEAKQSNNFKNNFNNKNKISNNQQGVKQNFATNQEGAKHDLVVNKPQVKRKFLPNKKNKKNKENEK